MFGVAPDGSSYCCSSPARTAMLATKIYTPAPASGKWLEYLCWGLRWGLRRELDSEPAGVVSGGPPVVAAGSSSMITTGSLVEILALFAILCAQVSPLWKWARARQVRKTETEILKGMKMRQENLLFLFLFLAKRGEVEIRLCARRGRGMSGVSWPLGGGCSGGLRWPCSSCRRSTGSSCGTGRCRGRASRTARWLSDLLPLRRFTDPTEALPYLRSWALR
jgi:hypothetical protein